ncbi:MAG: TatD family hydrolase [Victivallaceae bacterium]|nr:TatD family hydrolase [Victivallaceae bacterium]
MAADCHTHIARGGKELLSAEHIIAPCVSLEYHPWRVPGNFTALPPDFIREAPRAAALGECGLDRLRGAPLTVQMRAFEEICLLAETLRKGLVVHAVRCDAEIFAVLAHFSGNVLIHGFCHTPRRLETLLAKGFFVSLAPFAWRRGELSSFLKRTGVERIGFESDDGAVAVGEIVDAAQRELEIPGLDEKSELVFARFLGAAD